MLKSLAFGLRSVARAHPPIPPMRSRTLEGCGSAMNGKKDDVEGVADGSTNAELVER